MRARTAVLLIVVLAVIAIGWYWLDHRASTTATAPLKMLTWVGYDEPDYVAALEKATGRKVVVQTYSGGEQMYQLLTKSPPGTFDVVIVDAEFGRKLFAEKALRELTDDDWKFPDLLTSFTDGNPASLNGKTFGAVARWGAVGLVYNTTIFSPSDVQSYRVLLSPKAKGKVGIFDWYLPTMGILSKSLGNSRPYDLNSQQLAQLEKYLLQLRPQVASIQADTGAVIDDLRSGRVAIVPGIGEWASAALQSSGLPIDYVVPDEGGIMWVEAFAIPATARDPVASRALIAAAMRPETLAMLASRKAYFSQVSRKTAYLHIAEPVRKALKSTTPEDAERIAGTLQFRELPGPSTLEAQWLEVWNRFKVAR
ncbi:extracellular solute-binding protein [Sphingomonas sp.]|uniref:ABC transporter substrate-binding protein n=1 Tax=Sphingomonas sp. TaxID=28214 RepID=UPI001B06B78A|nr:extracellular solute-binding protein [Sphingomonas sp.]MBO9712494.1 extracellular solute-binding protein [Sphingomonas sp.]